MKTRRLWIASASAIVAVAAVVAVIFIWVPPGTPNSDCTTVRQLLDYNQSHNDKLTAQTDADDTTETSLSDLKGWASQLRTYAAEITDPRLAPHADRLAGLADQTITVVEEARDGTAQPPPSGPPPWAQKYADLNVQFRSELGSLKTACPA